MTVVFIERDERTRPVRVCWSYKLVCATMLFSFPSRFSLAYQLKSLMSDIEFMLDSLKKRKIKTHTEIDPIPFSVLNFNKKL